METEILHIVFKKMELSEDKRTVKISASCLKAPVEIKISILEIAKIFGTDTEIADEAENEFGSEELEEKCKETRGYVKKFPNIKSWANWVDFGIANILSVSDSKTGLASKKTVLILGENFCVWGNEGIRIKLNSEVYDNNLKGRDFKILVSPSEVKFVDLHISKSFNV